VAIPIEDSFEVEAPIERVWAYFSDPPQVVPCIPGAELSEVLDGNSYAGRVSLQVGPIRAQFDGTVNIRELDAERHSMTLSARGMQQGAAGRAEATLNFGLEPWGAATTRVHIRAEVSIVGKLAQLGGGMIQTVSRQLFRKFADCARQQILAGGTP
jgi:carbon monoxide dehydrogenase subunit G